MGLGRFTGGGPCPDPAARAELGRWTHPRHAGGRYARSPYPRIERLGHAQGAGQFRGPRSVGICRGGFDCAADVPRVVERVPGTDGGVEPGLRGQSPPHRGNGRLRTRPLGRGRRLPRGRSCARSGSGSRSLRARSPLPMAPGAARRQPCPARPARGRADRGALRRPAADRTGARPPAACGRARGDRARVLIQRARPIPSPQRALSSWPPDRHPAGGNAPAARIRHAVEPVPRPGRDVRPSRMGLHPPGPGGGSEDRTRTSRGARGEQRGRRSLRLASRPRLESALRAVPGPGQGVDGDPAVRRRSGNARADASLRAHVRRARAAATACGGACRRARSWSPHDRADGGGPGAAGARPRARGARAHRFRVQPAFRRRGPGAGTRVARGSRDARHPVLRLECAPRRSGRAPETGQRGLAGCARGGLDSRDR